MSSQIRCQSFLFGMAAAILLSGGIAQAAYPDHTVHLVVGFSPGGGTDLLARVVAQKLSDKWHQPVLVENRDGANGTIAEDHVAHSAPDGYTISWIANAHTIAPSELKLNYDPVKSFDSVSVLAYSPGVLLINASLPIKTIKEFIAYAKENPGKLNFGHSGTGSSDYLQGEMLMQMTGIKMTSVPFKGAGPTIPALMSNEIQVKFASSSVAVGALKSDKVRALAVGTKARSPMMPDLPTIGEALNLPNFDANTWYGVMVPAGTPTAIVTLLHDDFIAAIKTDEVQKVMADQGFVTVASSPAEMDKTNSEDMARWAEVMQKAGIAKK